MRAFLGFLTLYRADSTLFDKFQIPQNIDKNLVVNTILMELGEMEVIYPNPSFMKDALGFYSSKRLPVWNALEETLHYDYNPIENYNRKEEWADTGKEDETETRDSTSGSNYNRSESNNGDSHNKQTGDETTNTSVSAYNTDNYQPATESVRTPNLSTNETHSDTQQGEGTENTSLNEDISRNRSSNQMHSGTIKGNIGVTTTQKMIQEQRDVVTFSIVEYIVEDVKTRFCLGVY